MITNITIGSDPEFFIYRDNTVVSSIGILNGTKDDPEEFGNGFAILKDNVLLEMNVPPSRNRADFIATMMEAKNIASSILDFGGYTLKSNDSEEFTPEDLKPFEARHFGCAPYINAWTLDLGEPANLAQLPYRVAGTHIHIGYDLVNCPISKGNMDILITKAFDYFVVFPSRQIHNDPIRAKYYGDYGNFRNKDYGVECRSLGGYFSQDKYLGWVYDQTMKALAFCNDINNCELLNGITAPNIAPEANYEILNININEQIYEDTTVNIPTTKLITS